MIVGGGLCGAALAYHCGIHGLNVTLLETSTIGAGGATAHSGGIVRAYDPDPHLMAWGVAGTESWREWDLCDPAPFTACGMLYLVSERNAPRALAAARRWSRDDYPILPLLATEIVARFPELAPMCAGRPAGIAIYEPRGGYCDPRLAAQLFGHAARRQGASVLEGATVRRIEVHERFASVETDCGRIEASILVISAGANSLALLTDLPLTVRTIPLSLLHGGSRALPYCLIDEVSALYTRPLPPSHMMCGGAQQLTLKAWSQVPPINAAAHAVHLDKLRTLLGDAAYRAVGGFVGTDCYSADHMPLLGFPTDDGRLCLATGFSGRGAKYIPAAARWLSKRIISRLQVLS
jgi:glycine/D-amino acid oxidase-like deaminating enzyme